MTKQKEDGKKDFKKGEFSPEAAKARDAFLRHKEEYPGTVSEKDMTPLQRRMQSGDI